MGQDTNEYFLELLGITETLIDSIADNGLIFNINVFDIISYFLYSFNIDHPESIEILQYMLEHVIKLEADGYLTTPEANQLIGS